MVLASLLSFELNAHAEGNLPDFKRLVSSELEGQPPRDVYIDHQRYRRIGGTWQSQNQ